MNTDKKASKIKNEMEGWQKSAVQEMQPVEENTRGHQKWWPHFYANLWEVPREYDIMTLN